MEFVLGIALVAVVGALCCICFFIGAKVGQTVSKGEDIQTPTINPLKAYREHEQRKEAQAEQDRVETILRNIESYNGTASGQEDVPGR